MYKSGGSNEESTTDSSRPGPSQRSSSSVSQATTTTTTGIPVVDIANELGPVADTYQEEYKTLFDYLEKSGDVLGPCSPVIFVNSVRKLYRSAADVTADQSLRPYDKCVLLFRIFDALVLTYKNIGFVYCDVHGARSVYGYSDSVLRGMLARVEAIVAKVAVSIHDTYALTAVNEVVANTEQRLSQVRSENDMMELFRAMSGGVGGPAAVDSGASTRLPLGVEKYKDPHPEVDALFRLLYEYAANTNDYVREFHDAIYLLATANAPATLSSALETRLADKDRNIVLFDAPGDRMFASSMCASAVGYLRKTLVTDGVGRLQSSTSDDNIETYRINYGRIFSKYRGDSERNFSQMMEWIKSAVRGGDKFRVFWFPDIENLMAPRTSNDQEHIATIKNAMLQHMDDFNKDKTLRSFLLLFNASEGVLDSAFLRRIETVVRTPVDPLRNPEVAAEAVNAELARYHINLSDETFTHVVATAGYDSNAISSREEEDRSQPRRRIGGYAYVLAALRDMYVNQKLALKYGALAVDTKRLAATAGGPRWWQSVFGRYRSSDSGLFDLDGRAIGDVALVTNVSFSKDSRFATRLGVAQSAVPIRYNSSVSGDPKDATERDAAQTVYVHDW